MSKKKSSLPRVEPYTLGLPLTGADSHAHLDSPDMLARLPELMERATSAGVAHIGHVFLDPALYEQHRATLGTYPQLFFSMGFHPCDASTCTEQALNTVAAAFAADSRLRAVGEVGFDFYWKDCPPAVQEEALRRQLHLAKKLDLPVVIHSRDAATDTLRVLEDEGFISRSVLWHCFSGDAVAHMDRLLANGWHISVPGPITYPSSHELREAVTRIPPDRLLVETDCPYLAPNPWRGAHNEPAFVAFTAVAIAEIRQMDVHELWTVCGNNTVRFFGLAPLES